MYGIYFSQQEWDTTNTNHINLSHTRTWWWDIPPECPKLCLASSWSVHVRKTRPHRRIAPPTPHNAKRTELAIAWNNAQKTYNIKKSLNDILNTNEMYKFEVEILLSYHYQTTPLNSYFLVFQNQPRNSLGILKY